MRKEIIMLCMLLLCGSSVSGQSKGALMDKNGNAMRGTPMVLGKSIIKSVQFAEDIKNWEYLKNNGYNTVRLCWVDPYFKDRARDFWSVVEVLPHLDQVVENATKAGMNLIINLHNVGGQQRYDTNYIFSQEKEFWSVVAPRYKNNDLVYYEPINEPTFTMSDYVKPAYRQSYLDLYKIIRMLAPDRQVLMFSFNTCNEKILDVIRTYENDIDWSHTTIAYHMYGSTTSASIRKLMENHNVICTEWWYDHVAGKPGNSFVKRVDGFKQNAQTLEKIGSGWTDWRDWGDVTLNEVLDTLISDARSKNYWWGIPIQGLHASGISISENKIELLKGKSRKLTAFPLPALADDQKIIWTSSNKKIAAVDQMGGIAAKNKGIATVTAKTNDGGFTATCEVTVK